MSSSSTSDDGVRVLSSVKAYSRFLTVYDTCVEFAPSSSSSLASPSGGSGSGSGSGLGSSLGLESSASAVQQFSFDVVGHPRNSFKFACVMPVSISDNGQGQPRVTTTVVWEYAQGLNAICVGFPTGGFDASKHDTIVDTARAELAEEARLTGGELTCLVDVNAHPGMVESKWCRNRFYPFLCVGADVDANPPPRDKEEDVRMRVCQVTLDELRRLVKSGDMLAPSVQTAFLGLDELSRRGYC